MLTNLRFRFVALGLFLILPVVGYLAGCSGGAKGGGVASDWLGGTAQVINGTATAVNMMAVNSRIAPTETTALAIQIMDAQGRPADGAEVTLASLLGGTFDPATGQSVKGWFYTRYTAANLSGTETLTAMALGGVASVSLKIVAKEVATPTLKILTGAPQITPETPVSVAVYCDQNGILSNDIPVLLSSSKGGEFKENPGTITKGWFYTTFTPGAAAELGTYTIGAQVLGVTTDTTLLVANTPAPARTMVVTANPIAIYTGQDTVIVVQITDEFGAPANANLVMAADYEGTFEPPSGQSSNGVFYTTFTAGKEVGSATVKAIYGTTEGMTDVSIEKPILKITVKTASGRIKNSSTKNPISVYVADDLQRPIAKAEVLLSASLTGGTFESESGQTGDDGFFSTFYTAGALTGSNTFTAMAQGYVGTTTVQIW
jgi:hypothetical protein